MEKETTPKSKIFYEVHTGVFLLTSSFILGLFLSFYHIPFYLLLIPSFLFIAHIWIKKLSPQKKSIILWIIGLNLFFIGGEFYWAHLKSLKKNKDFEEAELLTRIERVEPYYQGYLIYAESSAIGSFIFKTSKKFFKPGDMCLLYFKRKKLKEYLNPFYTPKIKRLLVKGINSELNFLENKPIVCSFKKAPVLEFLRYKLLKFSEKLSGEARGLFQALVLGVEYNLPSEYLEKLKAQGLYHQLAISGFNLAILFGLFYQLSYFILKYTPVIKIGYPLQNFSYLLALPGAFLVLVFSGFCPSALRAFVFLVLFVVSRIIFKTTTSLIILFLTATLILLFQPYLIGNLSFQLSFTATLGLLIGDRLFNIYFKDYFKTQEKESHWFLKAVHYLIYSLFISSVVSMFVFPFLIYINGRFPLAMPLNNLIATGFWSFFFIPLALFIALLSFINENIALKCAYLLDALFKFYIKIPFFEVEYKAGLPVNLILFFILCVIVLFLLISRFFRGYRRYLVFILSVVLVYISLKFLYSRTFYITIFDVGRADAFLIKNKETNILIDTGPNYKFKGFNWTKVYLEPVLTKMGVEKFEFLIISHPDLDHAGGLNELKRDFYIKKIISGNFSLKDWQKVTPLYFPEELTQPTVLKIGETELFLFPGKRVYETLNRESLVVYLEYKGFTMLFPGDIDIKRFYRMKRKGEIIPVEVLVAPHHGSKNGFNEEILEWLNPEVVVISGRGKFHPHPEIISLIKKSGKPYFSTEKHGAIYIFPKEGYFLVCVEKEKRKKFWLSSFFPLIPFYIEGGYCKKFEYHRVFVE